MKFLMKIGKKATITTTLAILVFAGCFFASVDRPTLQETAVLGYAHVGEYQKAYDFIVTWNAKSPGCISSGIIQEVLNRGQMLDYVDEFQAMGFSVSAPNASTTPETTATPTPEPEAFTVEAYEPAKTMWATSEVNCRSGASTSYSKVGSLKQYEEVIVTGVASTGWYEITKEDGSKVYVSNKYLTEEDPSNRTVYDYDAETNTMNSYTFTDTDPEVIDEIVEQIKAEEETEENTEPIIEEKPTVVALEVVEEETTETEIEVEEQEQDSFFATLLENPLIIFGMVVCLVIGGIAVVVLVKNRRK